MSRVTVQVPMEKSLQIAATKVAHTEGFSSLQEAIRVFLVQLSNRAVRMQYVSHEPDEVLTPRQERVLSKKYREAKRDIKAGRGFTAKSSKELISHLRAA